MLGPKTGVRLVAFSTSGKSLTIARAMGMRGPGLGNFLIKVNPVDSVGLVKIPFITHFIQYPEGDQDAGCNPNCKTEHIDKRVRFLPQSISNGNFQIAKKHGLESLLGYKKYEYRK